MESFTSILDTDRLILLQLDLKSLEAVSQVNIYLNEIYASEYFWYLKVSQEYSELVVQLKPTKLSFRQQYRHLQRDKLRKRGIEEHRLHLLEASRYLSPFEESLLSDAVRSENLTALKWLTEEGLIPTLFHADNAAVIGNLEILNWLEQKGILPCKNVLATINYMMSNYEALKTLDLTSRETMDDFKKINQRQKQSRLWLAQRGIISGK